MLVAEVAGVQAGEEMPQGVALRGRQQAGSEQD